MKEKIKKLIADKIMEQAKINLLIQNLSALNLLDNDTLAGLLHDKAMLEEDIDKLKEILKSV